MHPIYTTEALVIESIPRGEADRVISLYTRDYGIVRAVAKGIRLEKSKLRYSMPLFGLCQVSLVKGREVWRLTNASSEKIYVHNRHLLQKAGLLLKRMSGESILDPHLFDSLKAYFEYVDSHDVLLKEAEIGIALHILNRSGYIPDVPVLKAFLEKPFDPLFLQNIGEHTTKSVGFINQALQNAHL